MGNNVYVCLCPKTESKFDFCNIANTQEINECIEAASLLEANKNLFEAANKYKEAADLIERLLNTKVHDTSEDCHLLFKLKATRSEILAKINHLKAKRNDEASLVIYNQLITALRDFNKNNLASNISIIYSNDKSKFYYISPDGIVRPTEGYRKLKIFKDEDGTSNIFLQAGNWMYPLIPDVSPWYKTEYNGFFFPDIHSEVPGSSIGLIIPEDDDGSLHEMLSDILLGQKELLANARKSVSTPVIAGAGYVSRGLVLGAENIRKLLNEDTSNLTEGFKDSQSPLYEITEVSGGSVTIAWHT